MRAVGGIGADNFNFNAQIARHAVNNFGHDADEFALVVGVGVRFLQHCDSRAKFLAVSEIFFFAAAENQREAVVAQIFFVEAVANIGLIQKHLIHSHIQAAQKVRAVVADAEAVTLPVEQRQNIFVFLRIRHWFDVAVNFAAVERVKHLVKFRISYGVERKTFAARNSGKPGHGIIHGHVANAHVRLDALAGNNQLHGKAPNDVVGTGGVAELVIIARHSWRQINFAVSHCRRQLFPVVEANVLEIAVRVVRQKFHVLVAVAGLVIGQVFIDEAAALDVADAQIFKLVAQNRFRVRHRRALYRRKTQRPCQQRRS